MLTARSADLDLLPAAARAEMTQEIMAVRRQAAALAGEPLPTSLDCAVSRRAGLVIKNGAPAGIPRHGKGNGEAWIESVIGAMSPAPSSPPSQVFPAAMPRPGVRSSQHGMQAHESQVPDRAEAAIKAIFSGRA